MWKEKPYTTCFLLHDKDHTTGLFDDGLLGPSDIECLDKPTPHTHLSNLKYEPRHSINATCASSERELI